ncbi:ProQ/FINO family protein [Candidatus Thiothrix sp. Deng01]|uniref:ProQ/FINO family protein n=1 Tax=Candidatus Thiothrix phosphatis TaxID=3112415 RepID=A0ABU6CVM7_9GAMM|nr:ProQ/FINO family protein [Candidatus Thiothrix sp. Deng01]MEB4590906.1 ProQ/FINO family protein [Candidatus Thiothrix sp. Deng01]
MLQLLHFEGRGRGKADFNSVRGGQTGVVPAGLATLPAIQHRQAGNPGTATRVQETMSDTPKKTLTLTRQPASGEAPAPGQVKRSGKRVIRREDLPTTRKPPGKPAGAGKGKPTAKKPARKPAPKKPVISPSDLKARELNDRLNAFSVWRDYLPLAIGVDKDVFRLVNEECFPGASKKVVQKTLAMHAKHGRYLQAVTQGGARYRLDGTEEGEITSYQQQLAAETIAKRQAPKG